MTNRVDKNLERWIYAVELLDTSESIVKDLERALKSAEETRDLALRFLDEVDEKISESARDKWGV